MNEEMKRRICAAWAVLVFAAQKSQVMTYEELGRLIGVIARNVGQHIEPIRLLCRRRNLPDLSCLVVDKKTGRPSTEGKNPHPDTDEWAKDMRKVMNHDDWRKVKAPSPEDFTADMTP